MTAPDGENGDGQGSASLLALFGGKGPASTSGTGRLNTHADLLGAENGRKMWPVQKNNFQCFPPVTLASLHRHVSPECFLHVPTAFATPGKRRPEASDGRRYPGNIQHQLWFTTAFTTKFTLGILEATGTRVHYIMSPK